MIVVTVVALAVLEGKNHELIPSIDIFYSLRPSLRDLLVFLLLFCKGVVEA